MYDSDVCFCAALAAFGVPLTCKVLFEAPKFIGWLCTTLLCLYEVAARLIGLVGGSERLSQK